MQQHTFQVRVIGFNQAGKEMLDLDMIIGFGDTQFRRAFQRFPADPVQFSDQ